VVDEATARERPGLVQRLLEGIENEAGGGPARGVAAQHYSLFISLIARYRVFVCALCAMLAARTHRKRRMDESLLILLGVSLALVALWLVVAIAALVFIGAITLFAWATESGFVGVAAYFACWIFMLPVMLIGSAIVGFVIWIGERHSFKQNARVDSNYRISQHEIGRLYHEPMSEYEKKRGF